MPIDVVAVRRLLVALLVCVAASLWSPAGSAQIKLFVSVLPLKHFAERVGGELVDVESLVQPGFSPATYEPTPRQIAGLASARAFVRAGLPFEGVWMTRIVGANPDMDIIDAREGVDIMPLRYEALSPGGPDRGGEAHHHGDTDPHIWLDPAAAAAIARTIKDYLTGIDPSHGEIYRGNAEAFIRELETLDARIRKLVQRAATRRFLVFHPAWGYFARAYGLEQLAVEHQGKEPGPKSLARLIELINEADIRTIFVQKQFSDRIVKTLAEEIDGRVVALDPLAEAYAENLLSAARAIAASRGP